MLVHGLFMNGYEMCLLRRPLRHAGYRLRRFHYRSVRMTPAVAAERLHSLVDGLTTTRIHFVCHSLGGLVVRHYFAAFPDARHGRVVTLGTPHQASYAADGLSRHRLGRLLLGRCREQGVCGGVPSWRGDHELGSVAGNIPVGMGRVVPRLPRPNDGTVSVAETRLPTAADHIVLPVTHMSILVAPVVSRQTVHFLAHGRFEHRAD